jgi:hypothetical protein
MNVTFANLAMTSTSIIGMPRLRNWPFTLGCGEKMGKENIRKRWKRVDILEIKEVQFPKWWKRSKSPKSKKFKGFRVYDCILKSLRTKCYIRGRVAKLGLNFKIPQFEIPQIFLAGAITLQQPRSIKLQVLGLGAWVYCGGAYLG